MPTETENLGSPEREIAAMAPSEATQLAHDARLAGLQDIVALAERHAQERAWVFVERNYPLIVDYLEHHMPWACEPDVFDDAVQIGRLLLFRAASTWVPVKTTFAGWAIAIFKRQYLIRLREFQGLYGPNGSAQSLLEVVDDAEDSETVVSRLAAPVDKDDEQVAEERAAFAWRMRDVLCAISTTPRALRLTHTARRAAVRWVVIRMFSLGKDRIAWALRLARRHGVRLPDLKAIDQEWRSSYKI